MKDRMQTFMQSLEYRIDNSWQPPYDATNTNVIHYILFDDYIKDNYIDFSYGDYLINVKVEEISEAYFDALD